MKFSRLAAITFLLLPCWAAAAPQQTPSLTLNHDFGIVKQGERLSHTFAIRNTNPSPLKIVRIDLNEAGITARFSPDIPPGAQGQIKLEWDTTHINGEMEETAIVRFNNPDQLEIPIELKVVAKPLLSSVHIRLFSSLRTRMRRPKK